MKSYLFTLVAFFSLTAIKAQNIYQEKFNGCELSSFCLDCGDTKAEPQASFQEEIVKNLNKSAFSKAIGKIEAQILIDENGKPCLLSVKNDTNISTNELKLKKAINNTSNWKPAISNGKKQNSSVSLIFEFDSGKISIAIRVFDIKNETNQKSVGTPKVQINQKEKLSKTWTLFNQVNSELPWDLTRAVVTDLDNNIWIGTDNGIVEITNKKWQLYNAQNTIIEPTAYNKNKTQSVRYAAVDKNNNKWFIIGWNAYKYDNKNWHKYDSINSPINWARKIIVDQKNNVWFTSWDGVAKFDGEKFIVFNKENSNLPSDKTIGVFIDKKDKIWIGTFEGNAIIEKGNTTLIDDKNSPLSKAFISKAIEDNAGNIWFSLYHDKNYKDQGIFILDHSDKWTRVDFPNANKILEKTSIGDFFLDEEHHELWVALNGIGILCYDLKTKKWEIYTNQNSNVPSTNAEKITKDKDGNIWVATYAGVIKLNR
ncbi:MAG: hypothetical protein LBI72_12590 [Flavobacteriaceae bacterium]|jgi:streptogramin lyase|nr:hypothetical protein [Flavobacteriaceae bacterium]